MIYRLDYLDAQMRVTGPVMGAYGPIMGSLHTDSYKSARARAIPASEGCTVGITRIWGGGSLRLCATVTNGAVHRVPK